MLKDQEPNNSNIDIDLGKVSQVSIGLGVIGIGLFLIGAGIKGAMEGAPPESLAVFFSTGAGLTGIGLATVTQAVK